MHLKKQQCLSLLWTMIFWTVCQVSWACVESHSYMYLDSTLNIIDPYTLCCYVPIKCNQNLIAKSTEAWIIKQNGWRNSCWYVFHVLHTQTHPKVLFSETEWPFIFFCDLYLRPLWQVLYFHHTTSEWLCTKICNTNQDLWERLVHLQKG